MVIALNEYYITQIDMKQGELVFV